MSRYVGPVGTVLGIVVIVVGAILQASGAAPVVFCSVIGGGIVLAILGAGVWIVRAVRHHGTGAVAA